MSDYDRDRGPDHERVTERTTVVTNDGGRRGGGGWLVAILLLVALLVLLFFLFGNGFDRAADEVGVNVNLDAPKVEVPDVKVDIPDEVKVDLPDEVKVETNGTE